MSDAERQPLDMDAATLRWAARRLADRLDTFPLRGRHTRAWWAVHVLDAWADDMSESPDDD